jgi:hypothetical protein
VRLDEASSVWDGVPLTARYKTPFNFLAEGLDFTYGGAYGVPYANFPRVFSRAIGRLPEGGDFDIVAVSAAA